MSTTQMCQRIDEELPALLEGTAPEELVEHLAACSRCRDARHEAERALEIVEDAGADYAHPASFEDRLLSALGPLALSGETRTSASTEARSTGHATVAPAPTAKKKDHLRSLRRPRNTIIASLVGAAAAAAVVVLSVGPPERAVESAAVQAAWRGEVASVTAAGGEGGLELCEDDRCAAAAAGSVVPEGARLRTDGRTRARVTLSDGTVVVLDRDTELSLSAETHRRASLQRGAIVADVAHDEDHPARIDLPRGRIEVLGTKFALRADGDSATVGVSRGSVRLVDGEERKVVVAAGEEGRILPGTAPFTTYAPSLGGALSWSEAPEENLEARGLGELRAKKPGQNEERQGAVRMTSHQVRVRIVDGFARTEIEEEFTNTSDEVLEGIYRFPLPPGAQIERLALDVEGGFEEGAFLDRERAAAIWRGAIVNAAQSQPRPREEIVWVPGPWKDPALLEWQRGGRFELRIFPIPKKGARRIILAYTEPVPVAGGVRRYTYPLPHDTSGDLRVDQFDLDLELRGHEVATGVITSGYSVRRDDGPVTKLSMNERGFVPSGDLVVEYASADRAAELSAWAYEPSAAGKAEASEVKLAEDDAFARAEVQSRDPYLALTLRPSLPSVGEEAQRAYALVVDSSRSMYGERYRRATALAARFLSEIDPLDTFTVLACDVSCRSLGGFRNAGHTAAEEARAFLAGIEPDGGSDPAAALREAASFASTTEGRRLEIVYLGDGTPTVGPAKPSLLRAAVEAALPPGRGRVTTVALGADADAEALAVMARAGGGVSLPYVPGQRLAEAAYGVLGATLGHALRDVRIELPAGVTKVAPQELDTLVAGGELLLTARLDRPRIEGDVVLRGKLGDQAFERRYPITVEAKNHAGNAFVPRLYAAARIGDLERDGSASARARAIAWSGAFNVASRFTSLLVLESPAMFKAFGLDNTRRVDTWTGDDLAVATATVSAEPQDALRDEAPGMLGVLQRPRSAPPARVLAADPWEGPSTGASGATSKSEKKKPAAAPAQEEVAGRRASERFVPMRKVWERQAQIFPGRTQPSDVTAEAIAKAELALASDQNRRQALMDLLALHARSGDLGRAEELAERWAEKEALDPEALTARADLAARRGDRERAVRMLSSVIDVRPGDTAALERLARLHRWAGESERACRYLMSLAQLRTSDAKALAEAVRCTRQSGQTALASELLRLSDDKVRLAAEREIEKPAPAEAVRGELQLTAHWQGGQDLDLALIDPKGQRVSWLGAPTRGIITAAQVTSVGSESLGLLGSESGEYVIEVVRGRGEGPVQGEIVVRAPGGTRTIPFTLLGDRAAVGTVRISWTSRLVPM